LSGFGLIIQVPSQLKGHIKDHGFRKGAATECTAGTTCAPSPSSVAQRGEWSLGKVFDVYWLFAEAGDQYCGRILAGLDSLDTHFDVLPPHFICGVENPLILNALKRNFHYIYKLSDENDEFANVKNLLLRCLASLVHHSDQLIDLASKQGANHPFWKIPLFSETHSLISLKQMVTTNPSHIIDAPTGIPPHVKQNKQLAELLVLMKQERDARNEQEKKIEEWVNNAVEKNALNNGTLTFSNFSNMLKEQRELINAELLNQKEDIDKKLDSLLSSLTGRHSGFIEIENNNTQANTAFNTEDMIRRNFHFWNGKYWHVPQDWEFPEKCLRKRGWELWLRGIPSFRDNRGISAPIMPFRRFDPKFLPKKLAVKFKTEWKVLYSKMMEGLSNNIGNANSISDSDIDASFDEATLYLKNEICSFIFTKEKYKNHGNWTIGTWSKRLRREMILKEGTTRDVNNLPQENHNNRKRKRSTAQS